VRREEFFAKWTDRAETLRRCSALVNGGDLCNEVLGDVRALLEDGGSDLLTLTDAATLSGYSADHLGRLVREGTVPNAGRPNAPRIRSQDLPRKPRGLAKQSPTPYDPDTDARTLLSRQRGGRHA
jgi:hypothetical protein